MKGLLMKELYTLKPYAKMYIGFIVIFGGVGMLISQPSFMVSMTAVMVFTLPISTFTIDEQCGWNRLAIAMPLSRRQQVTAKYLLVFMLSALTVVLQLLMLALEHLFIGRMDVGDFLVSTMGSLATIWFGTMILFPFIFKYGAEKGRIVMMIIFGALFALIMGFALVADNLGDSLSTFTPVVVLLPMAVVLLVSVVVSHTISCRIYTAKEF